MFPEWPYVKKLSLSYLSDEGNNKIAALDIPVSLSSNFDEEDKVLYWLFKRDFTDVRLYNLTKDEEVTRYGIAGILPQSGKVIVIGKFPHINSYDEILMYYGNRNAGNITSPELNVPMQPFGDECCVCYYMLDGKGYPDSVVEILWKDNGYWEGNYQYADVGNTKFAVGNTNGVPVVNFPSRFSDNNTLPFSITYCVTEFPSDQKWMGCIPKYDNDITFYMEGNTFIIATASETLVNMPIPELTSGQFQFVYIGVDRDTAEYRVYDVNKQLVGQGTVSANMTGTLTHQTTCLAGGYYDFNQYSCVRTGTAVVGRFRLFQRLLSQSETDILVDKDHYDNDYAYIDLRVASTSMLISNYGTISFGGMIEDPYNSLESLDENNICITLFDPGRADSSSDTGVVISRKCLGDDNFSIQSGGWTIYNISGINPDCKKLPFYTIYVSSSTRWLLGHRYVVGYSVPAIATHLKFGSYDESINFKKTAGVNINGAHLEPIDYENIIDPNHTSTTTEIYIDHNKIELQVGDLLRTDNDEYFQVQSINHDGDSYIITPDHTLSQPPDEVYFIGHRAIGYKASINKQKVINNISVSEQTQDIINLDVPSTTHKIYINNSLIDVKPGDIFNADNNELFEVAVVDNDGNVAYASDVRTVACGRCHTAIIKEDGSVWSTGNNGNGQLGLGDTNDRHEFTNTGLTAKFVACGDWYTVIIREDGFVWGTGANGVGQLGLGDTSNRTQFTNTGMTAKQVACGWNHTVIIREDGSVWGTGLNAHGQLGLGYTNYRKQFTNTGITAKMVACGYQHTVIIKDDGSVWVTGRNGHGQLGLGDTTQRNQFTDTGMTARMVACGYYYTVITREDGSVWLTGDNYHGQLGLGDTTDRHQFTNTGVTAKFVACGYAHTVIIRDDNSVWVTGYNEYGQLGLGDTNNRLQFTNTGLTAKQVACSREYTVIIREDGTVWSTGQNNYGQLGLGDTTERHEFTNTGITAKLPEREWYYTKYWIIPNNPLSQPPTSVYPVSKFNINGIQLQPNPAYDPGTGVQTYTFRNVILDEPSNIIKLLVDMSDVTTVTNISINLKSDPIGESINFTKTVGVDTSNDKLESTSYENIIDPNHTSTTSEIYIDYNKIELQVGDLLRTDNDEYFQVQSINHDGGMYSVVPDHTLNTSPNKVYFIGHRAIIHKSCMDKQGSVVNIKAVEYPQDVIDSNNPSTANKIYINNQLIDVKPGDVFNTDNNELFEVVVVDNDGNVAYINNVRMLACGYAHTVILKDDNSVWVTGRNIYGQLGLGDTNHRHQFTDTGITAKFVACGEDHTVIIKDDGSVWVTGRNHNGQLGLGDTNDRSQFTDTGITAKQVACGELHTVIIKDDGSVWSTGYNFYGQLGLGDTDTRTQFTNTGITAKFVTCGHYYTIIIKDDNSVWGTGANGNGQLGLGDTNNRTQFTDTGITAKFVACGEDHTVIIKNDNSVWATGENNYGQLGLGDTSNRNQFTDTGITAIQVACGNDHTAIIREDGSVWSAGWNGYGQLGLGDTTQRNQFVNTGITAKFVACGSDHTVIIREDGFVWGTGDNSFGQLGLGDTNDRNQFTNTGVTVGLFKGVYYTKYWVIPNNPLSQPPTSVYPVSKFSVDGILLHSAPIYDPDVGMQFYAFQGIALPDPSDVVKFSVDISEGTTVNKILIDLVSDIDPKFGSGKMLMIFTKTAGTDVEEGKLKPIDYENIIDPNHASTTTKIYIDYNKIELQEGDSLKTDNDEHFQVQSINRSGTVYYITPDHTLDNPPNEVYFIGHRGIAFKEFEREQQSVNIIVSEQTQNVIDPYHTSIPTKIYINNRLINVKPGDVFSTGDGELFEVAVVDNDGNVACIDCVKMIACGDGHTVVIREDSSVWVTGGNYYGQLGLGDTTRRIQFVNTGITAKQVACGSVYTVIIKDDNSVWVTGWNGSGQLGLGDTNYRNRFTNTGMTAKQVACGCNYTVIIREDGSVWVTGNNEYGQLGLGDTNSRYQFTNTGITARCAVGGYGHTVIIKDDGSVWSTGRNSNGELGLGDTSNRNQFTDTGMTARFVACGWNHTVIIRDDNSVWVTGENYYGQLGLGDTSNRNQFTDTGITAEYVACGGYHTVIIKDDGSVWVTGRNNHGQLGLGDTTQRNQFTNTGMTAKQVACGDSHTAIIKDDGSLWVTGANWDSQLGLGDTNDRHEFVWSYGGSGSYYTKYWVIPNNPLSKAPMSVYPVSRFNVNGLQLQPDPVYNPETGMLSYTFSGINLPAPSNTIKLSVDISDVTVVTEVLLSLSE